MAASLCWLLPAQTGYGQKLPNSIRGYKVHHASASVTGTDHAPGTASKPDIAIKIDPPSVVEMSLSGAVFEVDAEFTAAHSGKVDMISFHDLRANDIPFAIDDISTPFSFKKNATARMSEPARVSVSLASIPRALYKQISEDPSDLKITGRAFVFGRFKRFGMTFKRVVPIAIDIKIKNPLHNL